MKACIQAKKKYPHLIAGYDVVGPEDMGRTLHDLTPELLCECPLIPSLRYVYLEFYEDSLQTGDSLCT